MEDNIRVNGKKQIELTKNISLAMLDSLAFIELKKTGKCYFSLPEGLFDLDFPGHYFRRIKSVSLSIPCKTGPKTTIRCSLRLLKDTILINTTMDGKNGEYKYNQDKEDDRFRTRNVPINSITTSTRQNDTGMFEFNFRDERYHPFEGAGAISDWMIELTGSDSKDGDEVLRQFDYSGILDVILHLKFTARESGNRLKGKM